MNYNGKKDFPENEKMPKPWIWENSINSVDIALNKVSFPWEFPILNLSLWENSHI